MCVIEGGEEANEVRGGGLREVDEAVSRKKDAHKIMCRNSTEENKRRCKAKKAMREKAEEAITELKKCSSGMFRLVKD